VKLSSQLKVNIFKGVVAFLSMTALIVWAARDGGSNASALKIGLIFLAISIAAALICIPLIWANATFNQFLIRNGAVDTKWYMFDSDPSGLAALRHQLNPTKVNKP
jgi:hypothetical protein